MKNIFFISSSLLILLIIAIIVISYIQHQKILKEMDKKEIHYDANGLLVLVNSDEKIIALYNGFTRIDECYCDSFSGIIYDYQIVLSWDKIRPFLEIDKKWYLPAETPVIIYRSEL